MKNNKKNPTTWQFATKAIHSGFTHDPTTGAVMPPIYMTSTFAQVSPGQPISHYEYSRTANPTRDILQTNLAALENGKHALCFASGCAALTVLLQTLPPDSHIIVSDDVYGGTLRLFNIFAEKGLSFTQCDMTNREAFSKCFTAKTRLVWLETPSNPLLKILDIAALCQTTKKENKNIWVAVDNTFATPYLQNPLEMGADIVCHSTTKYIGGHSDILGGALIFNDDELAEKLFFLQNAMGAVPSPMDCFLLLRSIKTLALRMQTHCHNAHQLAEYLSQHPKVAKVYYPGLPTHPQHALASTQMRGFGGMISIILKGQMADATHFLQQLKLFTLAESLGGVESLVEQPAIMTHAAIPAAHRQHIGIEDTLIRLSVGIEAFEDLLADIEQALQ